MQAEIFLMFFFALVVRILQCISKEGEKTKKKKKNRKERMGSSVASVFFTIAGNKGRPPRAVVETIFPLKLTEF